MGIDRKNLFNKGIASGLNSLDIVSSPSFSIIKEYDGTYPFSILIYTG